MNDPHVTKEQVDGMNSLGMFNALKENESKVIRKFLDEFFRAERNEELEETWNDEFENPDHYLSDNGMKVFDVIDEFRLNFNLGNVVKYVLRAGKKSVSPIKDLNKALRYIKREINAQEEEEDYRGRD